MKLIPLVLTLFLKTVTGFAQEVIKESEFEFNESDRGYLGVGGNVDFYNTFVHKPWPEYYDVFHNLVEFSIINTGSSVVTNPFISINGSKFFLDPSEVDGALVADNTFDKHAVNIWKRFTEQVIHRYYPYEGYRQGTPIEMLTGFGYGICYNNAAAITRLPKNENNFFYDLVSFKHSVPEYRIGDRAVVLDGDLKSFYLDHQNNALASKAQISHDRYLIKRSHHYGRQYSYNRGVNDYIAHLYLHDNLLADTPPEHFSINYQLVPGEKLTIQYTPGKYFFSEYYSSMDPNEFANGFFDYDWKSASSDFHLQKHSLINFKIDSTEGRQLIKIDPEEKAALSLELLPGFQTVFFRIYFDLAESDTTTPSVRISPDSATWISATEHIIEGNRQFFDFNLQEQSFKRKIYLQVHVGEGESRIDNFGYTSYFQLSRLSLPGLKQGSNEIILVNKQPNDSLRLHLKYRERTAQLSNAIVDAVHPKDNEIIAGTIGEIVWTNPYPDEEVVNYEFLLTRDTIDGLPLAPNFEIYTVAPDYSYVSIIPSSEGRVGRTSEHSLNPWAYLRNKSKNQSFARSKSLQEKNKLAIHEEGFFNSGDTYFWRVRPLHANGVWGPWSRYFSFALKKIMPPTGITVEGDTLSWENNLTGTTPVSFQIHGSNEYLGFEPTVDNLIAETTKNKVAIAGFENTFFRVIAVDSSGARSEMSRYAIRPYPFLSHRPDTVKPGALFKYRAEFPKAYYKWISEGDSLISYTDEIGFSVVSMPDWLRCNYTTGTLEGSTTAKTLKEEFYQGKNFVEFVFKSEIFAEPRHFSMELPYVFDNSVPDVRSIDTTLYTKNYFSFSIPYSDQDKEYGDSVSFVLKNKPDWLKFHWSADSVSFYGDPEMSGVSKVTLIAEDKYGDTAEVVLRFNILSSEIHFDVATPRDNSLTLSMDTILTQQGIIIPTFNLANHSVPGFQIKEEDNILTVIGDFCAIRDKKELAIPFELLTSSSASPVKLELTLTVTNHGAKKEILVFHPENSDVLIVQNELCSPREFEYVLLNSSGQTILSGRSTIFDSEELHLPISHLFPGLYIVIIRDAIRQESVKFIWR